jgi:hypothetical protein
MVNLYIDEINLIIGTGIPNGFLLRNVHEIKSTT